MSDAYRHGVFLVDLPTRKHRSYIQPITGGCNGYRPQCKDCEWRDVAHTFRHQANPIAEAHAEDEERVAYCPHCDEAL